MAEPEVFPGSETLDIPVQLETRNKTRARSNSKVYGKPGGIVPQAHSPNGNGNGKGGASNGHSNSRTSRESSSNRNMTRNASSAMGQSPALARPRIPQRDQFAHIIILTSLNETFDKKTLVVPTHPDVLKLGRPNSSQKAPSMYNGYFDSRVISREHAEFYIRDGIVYLRDCNSSNGTFVNGDKIKEHELKEGDNVDLGVDVDTEKNKHQHHRKIACMVESILTIPIDGTTDLNKILEDLARDQECSKRSSSEVEENDMSPFDAAMFGDVTRNLEDVTLGINHDFLSGLFMNNNIGTSSNLVHSIRLLINQLHQEKMNNMKLDSVVQFLEKYRTEVERPGQSVVSKLKEYKELVEDLKKKNNKHKVRILELEQNISSRNELLEDLQFKEKEAGKNLQQLLHTLSEERQTNDAHSKSISTLETQLQEKTRLISKLEADLSNAKLEITAKETTIDNLKDELLQKDDNLQSALEKNRDFCEKAQTRTVCSDMLLMTSIAGVVMLLGAYILK
ncbi:Vacuolar protein sorting-associated protein 64 [Cyberlindnera fabianii]|uniref:Vacuolar protein sorting-associated protein 64 n=1 Tax=Cyberlindnera fabianii TaxID=36022 RepID=A0A1V2L437_CYBFA|nr:Vacuolar protein sorting-associated protein 64 [Cyberlindnera fabianii]